MVPRFGGKIPATKNVGYVIEDLCWQLSQSFAIVEFLNCSLLENKNKRDRETDRTKERETKIETRIEGERNSSKQGRERKRAQQHEKDYARASERASVIDRQTHTHTIAEVE